MREAVSATAARPFPWSSLDATSQAEVRALRAVRRWAEAHADLRRLPTVLAQLLGVEVAVRVRQAEAVVDGGGRAEGAAVLLVAAGEQGVGRAALVQGESALVSAVLRRVAHRPVQLAFDPAGPLPAGAFGAFAAVVAAAARRAHQGLALHVLAAGPPSAMLADLARGGDALVGVTLTVLIDHDAFDARIVVSQGAALAAPSFPWNAAALAALGPTPLAIPLVACGLRMPVSEVARLCVGDVFVPAAWTLARERQRQGQCEEDALQGPVWLAAPAAEFGVRAQLVPGGRLVLGGALEPLCQDGAPEASMGTNAGKGVDKAELIDAIGDVPVLVRVELGEARMAAREWAAVGTGDVVTLGRRVGESVLLRVGGVPVARGDLVEVDGEVGVRIVERLVGDGGSP